MTKFFFPLMPRRAACALIACFLAAASLAAAAPAGKAHRMEITLERLEGKRWSGIDPRQVVESGARVRFRFRTNFDGYLYVTNQSTSGTTTLLFPRQDTGLENRVEAGRDYVVPAATGAFRVEGPAGHDVISWLISPVSLGKPDPPSRTVSPMRSMVPRCDDTIFRARGECV
ncbi:MAG: DUF4384 domain-containing protein, partial [Bryobacteraceae bacterium]